MKITLSDGSTAVLHIMYTRVTETYRGHVLTRRATRITVEFDDGYRVSATSVCAPQDQFVKRTGRFIAGRKLAQELRDVNISPGDRALILRPIFNPPFQHRGEPDVVETLASLAADLHNAPGFLSMPTRDWFTERADILIKIAKRLNQSPRQERHNAS